MRGIEGRIEKTSRRGETQTIGPREPIFYQATNHQIVPGCKGKGWGTMPTEFGYLWRRGGGGEDREVIIVRDNRRDLSCQQRTWYSLHAYVI